MSCGQEPFYANAIVFDTEGAIQIKTNTDGDMLLADKSTGYFVKLSDLTGLTQADEIRNCDDVMDCVEENPQVIKKIIDCNYIQECIDDQSIVVLVEMSDWTTINVDGQTMYEVYIPHGLVINSEPATLMTSIYDSSYDIISFDKVNVGSTDGGEDAIYIRSTASIEFYISVRKA